MPVRAGSNGFRTVPVGTVTGTARLAVRSGPGRAGVEDNRNRVIRFGGFGGLCGHTVPSGSRFNGLRFERFSGHWTLDTGHLDTGHGFTRFVNRGSRGLALALTGGMHSH